MALLEVVRLELLREGDMTALSAGGWRLLLLRIDGRYHALEDRCAHQGQPLARGRLEDGVLTCPVHHYAFDARTGAGVNPRNLCLRSFPVTLSDGFVLVDLPLPTDRGAR